MQRQFSHLRLAAAGAWPGRPVGLREFAAYRETSDVPAAIKLAAEAPERQLAEPFDLTGESEFLPEGVKLQEGLQVAAVADLPPGFRVKQLVPSASGAVFVLVAAEDKSSAGVVLVSQE